MALSLLAIIITYDRISTVSLFEFPSLEILGMTLIQGGDFYLEGIIKLLMIFFVAAAAYEGFDFSTVHGGTPEQIIAKARMFEIAKMRLDDAKVDVKASSIILYELGDQAINENNDWAFEHKTKDFKEKSDYDLSNLSKR